MPRPELAERLVRASYWYPTGVNKLEALGFQTTPAQVLDPPLLTECRAHIECRLVQAIPTGDHTTLIADVVAASYDGGTYAHGMLLDVEKAPPLLHLRHFNTLDGQAHVFLTGTEIRVHAAPFPPGGIDAEGRPTGDEED